MPEVLLVPDLALVMGAGTAAARKAVLRGEFGPFFRLGRRLAVRRATFLAAIADRETLAKSPIRLLTPPASPSDGEEGGL